jgi:hypothetical protein
MELTRKDHPPVILVSLLIVATLALVFLWLVWPSDSDIPPGFAVWFAFCGLLGLGVTGLAGWALIVFATNYKG